MAANGEPTNTIPKAGGTTENAEADVEKGAGINNEEDMGSRCEGCGTQRRGGELNETVMMSLEHGRWDGYKPPQWGERQGRPQQQRAQG